MGSNQSGDVRATTNIEDTSLVAFLKLQGHVCIPWISRDDPSDVRVSFDIQGDEATIVADIQKFYDPNFSVRVQDFCKMLKDVKSSMYNLKRVGKKT
jgi:hypothetical protein